MANLTINDNPTISDTIVFTLLTPDANGCFLTNPYVVNSVTIYFVERDFANSNLNEYNNETYDLPKLQAAVAAQALACSSPTSDNIANAQLLNSQAQASAIITPFYFTEASPIEIIGNDSFPAWLSTDTDNALIDLVTEDANGNPVYGQFTYTWQPQAREGDYFICWTWTPLIAGDSLSSHIKFYLAGDTGSTTSIPTHYTDPTKYPTLLERYTPEMFKMLITNNDLTISVLDNLNGAIALGFNTLEDLTNQIVDLQDANVLAEPLLPYLSNLFNLKLKTLDPTRWRGQIKRAIPLFKSKGTKKGLIEGLEHAAIKLVGLYQLWQVISPYTWQDAFTYDGSTNTFTLTKVALPIDYNNFALWLRPPNDSWISLNLDYIDFNTNDGATTITWVGSGLSIDPIDLIDGDEILVLYKYNYIPDDESQTIENYIRTLPLLDQRDERNQIYPLKNWNVRLIQENDPMFDLVVPTRHPFCDPVIFGQVRTEFPYSENIFNMDEYNSSLRDSTSPCDIDNNFIDPCSACIGSNYNIDLEIENLCDDRIAEAKEVLTEFMPFHATLSNFNFIGGIHEFVQPPVEEINCLVSIIGNEFVIAGEAQTWFNRIMQLVDTQGITRGELATQTLVLTTSGTAYNDEIVVFCPTTKLDEVGMNISSAELHILSPSPLSGTYDISNPCGNAVNVSLISPATEPINNCNNLFANNDTINSCAFAFDINNVVTTGTLCNITQDNFCVFSDATQNFGTLSVQSLFDVSQGTASAPWQIKIPAYSSSYVIQDILSNGNLIIINDGSLPTNNTLNISYTLIDSNNIVHATSNSGTLTVTNRALVTCLSSSVLPVYDIITNTDNFYFTLSGTEYPIIGFPPSVNNQFYISNYNIGSMGSVNLQINQKVVSQEVGYFTHRGLKLQISGNLESSLGIQNGVNSLVVVDDGIENGGFMENFIIVIGPDSYFMTNINGNSPTGYTTITLSGADHYWETLGAGGTSVSVNIYQYIAQGATIMGQQFDLPTHTFRTLTRSGSKIIDETDEDGTVTGLSFGEPSGNQVNEFVRQKESISFHIEYADGTTEEGEI